MGTSFRGSTCSKLVVVVPAAYGIPMPLTPVGSKKIEGLLTDENLTWKLVGFDDKGNLQGCQDDPEVRNQY